MLYLVVSMLVCFTWLSTHCMFQPYFGGADEHICIGACLVSLPVRSLSLPCMFNQTERKHELLLHMCCFSTCASNA